MLVYNDDCLYTLTTLGDNSIDSIVTDPPYELKFMGNKWDATGISFRVDVWEKCLTVLKPGGFLLSFGSPKNIHRMICAIEDAGFIIKDCIQWLYGTGFPHGQNIGKKVEGYEDWHTSLKPACEIIVVAQKPISEKNIADNVAKWGTGAFNIGACRISHNEPLKTTNRKSRSIDTVYTDANCGMDNSNNHIASANPSGRFPTNVIIDEEVAIELDKQSGITKSSGGQSNNMFRSDSRIYRKGVDNIIKSDPGYGDVGGASRFYYCSKASKKERGEYNTHQTVKPLALMKYLVRLVTPPKGKVLDPFMGSGTTGLASLSQGFDFIGIEKEKEYYDIALRRLKSC